MCCGLPYLQYLKMNNFHNCVTKHSVNPIFSIVSYRVESAITTPNCILCGLQLADESCPVSFPVMKNGRKQKLLLVYKVCPDIIHGYPHMTEDQKDFANRCSSKQYCKTQENISSWISFEQWRIWLTPPGERISFTMRAVLKNSNHGASLFHHNLGLSSLAPKTKHQKQTLKHAEEHYKLWFIFYWSILLHPLRKKQKNETKQR